MNVAGIESSGRLAPSAACRDETVLAEMALDQGMAQGRLLVSLVDRVIAAAGWDKRRDVELIAVSQGPGSFTGLRVGLTWREDDGDVARQTARGRLAASDAMAENAPADALNILTPWTPGAASLRRGTNA